MKKSQSLQLPFFLEIIVLFFPARRAWCNFDTISRLGKMQFD